MKGLLVILCIHLNAFSISSTRAVSMSQVHEWSNNLEQKFNKFTKDYMRMPELQKKFDSAPRSETILSGNVVAASTATRITSLLEQKDAILISMASKIKSVMSSGSATSVPEQSTNGIACSTPATHSK